ncbi:Hypothetical protein CGB_C0340W [Cryptococcus gattii WM276]|uniref:Uncharacterized protein n=2 Tax=Cryptococcus gattii TaxID=37769 RepID=E6R2L4_CRYGW|nr:Hypothetical protein CGB_C0340W [Cryptococcus gattii WM276]ADV20729.1 Hypothetical protein CGB_C0340W [Cryptococcus gattii WM276]KJE03569.1 hypothetical protein I311_02609 [Cryptococcus gattii NT-10]
MEVGEISSHIWFTNATEDDILEKYAQFLGIGPAMLMYYNDALSLAALVLAPLRVLLEIVLANHEPPDEVEGIFPVSACNKTDDNTVYGAVARYGSLIHRHAMDVKHINISNVRQIFPQILSAANICDEINVALKLDNDNYDKEADGGFKTEVTASLNVPLNERNLFNQDKTNLILIATTVLSLTGPQFGPRIPQKKKSIWCAYHRTKIEGHWVFDRHNNVRALNREWDN